jgi:hypothetical protein
LRIYILNRRFGFGGRKRGGGGFLGFEERRERVSDRERTYKYVFGLSRVSVLFLGLNMFLVPINIPNF